MVPISQLEYYLVPGCVKDVQDGALADRSLLSVNLHTGIIDDLRSGYISKEAFAGDCTRISKEAFQVRRWGPLIVCDEVVISLFEISWRLKVRYAARGLF